MELDEFKDDDEWDAFCNLPGPAFNGTIGSGQGPLFDKFKFGIPKGGGGGGPLIFGMGGGPETIGRKIEHIMSELLIQISFDVCHQGKFVS